MMERANNEHVILMDGATGTEVERRGVAQLNTLGMGELHYLIQTYFERFMKTIFRAAQR